MNSQEAKSKSIVGKHNKIHTGEKRWIERQYPMWRGFVPTIAKAIEAGRGSAKIDDQEKKGREFIQTEMSSDPRQSKRQRDSRGGNWLAHNVTDENQQHDRRDANSQTIGQAPRQV